MRIDNDEFDKTQELATCSWLLMNKVEDAMEEHGKSGLQSPQIISTATFKTLRSAVFNFSLIKFISGCLK